MKKCSLCNQEKELSEFYRWSRGKDGYQSACKDCDNKRSKKYREEHKEEIKERKRKYWEKNSHKFLPKHIEYYNIHREEILKKVSIRDKKNRKELTDYHREWRRRTGKGQIHFNSRRQREKNCGGRGVTDEQWTKLCNLYGNICLCCKQPKKLTLDHVIPLSKGGEHDILNIQPLCANCNSSKGVKSTDYREKLPLDL